MSRKKIVLISAGVGLLVTVAVGGATGEGDPTDATPVSNAPHDLD